MGYTGRPLRSAVAGRGHTGPQGAYLLLLFHTIEQARAEHIVPAADRTRPGQQPGHR